MEVRRQREISVSNNALVVLNPYWFGNTWVFDDPRTNLVREPFVAGIPEMISRMVVDSGLDLSEAHKGISLMFAATPYPGYQTKATKVREEFGGNWYVDDTGQEGWLCPALFCYYDEAPDELYSSVLGYSRR